MDKQTFAVLGSISAILLIGAVLWNDSRPSVVSDSAISEPTLTNNSAPTMTSQIEGLQIEILTPGSGEGVKSGQVAVVHYTGMFTDGKVFDSSIPRGQPFPVNLGKGEVIKGWDLGLVGMKVGEKRRLTISPELGYGKDGFPGAIPPNATLIFEVSLEEIQ